jgi:hypothetical protein
LFGNDLLLSLANYYTIPSKVDSHLATMRSIVNENKVYEDFIDGFEIVSS